MFIFFSPYQNRSRRPNVRDMKYHISGESTVAYRRKRSRFRVGCGLSRPSWPTASLPVGHLTSVNRKDESNHNFLLYILWGKKVSNYFLSLKWGQWEVIWGCMRGTENMQICVKRMADGRLWPVFPVRSWSFIDVYMLGWECGSVVRVLAKHVRGPRFNIQYWKKGGGAV